MNHRILVLGAGYAGMMAAHRLNRLLSGIDITVVNADDKFAERTRMHQLAAGQRLADVPLSSLVAGSGINLVIDRVTGIDTIAEEVELASGQRLRYDTLLYALGSHGQDIDGFSVATPTEAQKLRDTIAETPRARVGVIGAGLTGIEAATELAESYPDADVSLLCDRQPGYELSEKAQRHIAAALDRLGVTVHIVQVDRAEPGQVVCADGRTIPVDVPVWTTGFAVPPLAREAGLDVDADGRIHVDSNMRALSQSNVYAIGDAAAAKTSDGDTLRMACATAGFMAFRGSTAISAHLTGRKPPRFRFRYVAQQLSLGRHDGFVQFVHANDSTGRLGFGGRFAALLKEWIFRATLPALRRGAPHFGRRRAVTNVDSKRMSVI